MKIVKPKAEVIILAVAIVALLLYVLRRDPDRMNYRLPALPAVARADVDRIDIVRSGQAVRLEKKDGQWLIQPQGFSAAAAKINAILDVICDLRLTALVSESGNDHPYGLDRENEIVIKAYRNERLLRHFSVGNAVSTYSHTYVKLAGDHRVFHAGSSFRSDLDAKVDDLRDKTVLQFAKNEIVAVEVNHSGERALFVKNAKALPVDAGEKKPEVQEAQAAAAWLTPDGRPANDGELNGIIERTSQLSCEGFIEGKGKEDFKEPVYTVLLKGRKDFLLSIFQKDEKEISYPALSSESPYPFLLSAYQAESIMKKPEILKKETTPAK